MNFLKRIVSALLLLGLAIQGKEITLQNGDTYSGCDDGYLSAIYETPALKNMIGDTLTNFFSKPDIYLSR